jgi:ABC-type dipeptide/oligopeptide/nickel transport system permease subunit
MKEDKNIGIPKEKFQFVQKDDKIFDKDFETVPIGYFKDAMIRFSKNRTNIVATVILSIIILMSIFQPIFTNKNYTDVEANLSLLPPRIPILENFGIADGTIEFERQPVDLSTIDLETGFQGNPIGTFQEQYIIDETREYQTEICSIKDPLCIGGETIIRVDSGSNTVTVESNTNFPLSVTGQQTLLISVSEFLNPTDSLDVLVRNPETGEFVVLQTITSVGDIEIDVPAALASININQSISSRLRLRFNSSELRSYVALTSVELFTDSQGSPLVLDEGFNLSSYNLLSLGSEESGTVTRRNGEILTVTFRYDSYNAVFGQRTVNAMAKSEYEDIVATNACVQVDNPSNPNGWLFEEGCPIVEVVKENPGVVVGGVSYGTYQVNVDYALIQGYEDIPYFLFGTTNAGRDLYSLIWVATRTSLVIGVIVSAINITIGVLFGAISGYYGGAIDMIMQRLSEVVGRIPFLVILAIFVATLGGGIQTLIFILIVSGWIGVAYVTRTQFYRFKGREYVLASRTLGAKDFRLIFRHILPNGIGTIITASILLIPATIFAESTISYLGFGIGHGSSFNILGFNFSGVSVGVLLADGRPELLTRPHLTTFPAIVISILMITFNMFGNALRDALNPALRGSL